MARFSCPSETNTTNVPFHHLYLFPNISSPSPSFSSLGEPGSLGVSNPLGQKETKKKDLEKSNFIDWMMYIVRHSDSIQVSSYIPLVHISLVAFMYRETIQIPRPIHHSSRTMRDTVVEKRYPWGEISLMQRKTVTIGDMTI